MGRMSAAEAEKPNGIVKTAGFIPILIASEITTGQNTASMARLLGIIKCATIANKLTQIIKLIVERFMKLPKRLSPIHDAAPVYHISMPREQVAPLTKRASQLILLRA